MLPGIMSAIAGVMGGGGMSLSLVATAQNETNTVSSITIPAGAAIGDLAVFVNMCRSGEAVPALVTPAGWTVLLNESVGGYLRTTVHAKKLASGEPGSSITGMTTSGGNEIRSKYVMVFTVGSPIASFATGTWGYQSTSGDPTPQTVPTGTSGSPAVVFGFSGTTTLNAANPFSTFASDAEVAIGGFNGAARFGYKIVNTPADVVVDRADIAGTTNVLFSGYVSVS